MLGFDALGRLALGEVPGTTPTPQGQEWTDAIRKTGLSVAVIATTFVGFVPPPPAQAAKAFTQFSQPQAKKALAAHSWRFNLAPTAQPQALFSSFSQPIGRPLSLPDEQPSAFFEVLPPQAPPFTGFANFEGIIKARFNVALFSQFRHVPFVVPIDTHDGVFVKRKSKRKNWRDPIELEIEERAKRRYALELAIYGPEPSILEPIPVEMPVIHSPPDVMDLAKMVFAAQQAQAESIRAQQMAADEDDLESILREIL